jgi:hypothetical protein
LHEDSRIQRNWEVFLLVDSMAWNKTKNGRESFTWLGWGRADRANPPYLKRQRWLGWGRADRANPPYLKRQRWLG